MKLVVVPTEGGPTPSRVALGGGYYSNNPHQNQNDNEEQGGFHNRDASGIPIDSKPLEGGEQPEEEEEEEKQDEEGKKEKEILVLLEKGVLKTVDEKLIDLPRKHAWAIAAVVIIFTLSFLITLTVYNVNQCDSNMAIIVADWDEDFFLKKFQTGSRTSTHLCITLGKEEDYPEFAIPENDDQTYNIACLLKGFSGTDFDTKHCPPFSIYGFPGANTIADVYANPAIHIPTCKFSASVLYVECPIFSIAFGSALGYVTYIHLFLIFICFIIYRHFHPDSGSVEEFMTPGNVAEEKAREGILEYK